jgi:hypothetical protein
MGRAPLDGGNANASPQRGHSAQSVFRLAGYGTLVGGLALPRNRHELPCMSGTLSVLVDSRVSTSSVPNSVRLAVLAVE